MAIEISLLHAKSNKNLKSNLLEYEPKVRLDGTFEDVLRKSAKGIGIKKKD
jgi:hypothetical protein